MELIQRGARAGADADGEPHLHRHGAGGAADAVDVGRAAVLPGRPPVFRGGPCARGRAKAATEDDLAALKRALDANRKAIGDSRSASPATDIAFHFELAEIARNPIFIALHDQISDWLTEQRVVTLSGKRPGAAPPTTRTRRSTRRIAARDADKAEAAMRDHLEQLAGTFWHQRGES